MFGLEQKVDKVNMSLDDIIKLNKKQNKDKKIGASNNAKQSSTIKNDLGQQHKRRFNKNIQNQPGPSKKASGILGRSKSIQKNKLFKKETVAMKANKQKNNVQPVQLRRRQPQLAQFIGNRRRKPNNNNRAKHLIGNPKLKIDRSINRIENKKPVIASTVQIIKPSGKINHNLTKEPLAKLKPNKVTKAKLTTKIKMQTARKNVQKAKRLLITKKKPVKQLMTQKYATKMGILRKTDMFQKVSYQEKSNKKKILQQPKKQVVKDSKPKMMKISIANKINKIRIQKAKKKQEFKKKISMAQTKNKTSTRQRPQGGLSGKTSSRMVFLK